MGDGTDPPPPPPPPPLVGLGTLVKYSPRCTAPILKAAAKIEVAATFVASANFLAASAAANSAKYFLAKASLLSRIANCALIRNLVSSSVAELRAAVKLIRSRSNWSLSLSTAVLALSWAFSCVRRAIASLIFFFSCIFANSTPAPEPKL